MSGDKVELDDYFAAASVANALRNGDFEVFAKITEVLHSSGADPKTADLVLGIIWDLLPDEAHGAIMASAEAKGKSMVIDWFTRKPRT